MNNNIKRLILFTVALGFIFNADAKKGSSKKRKQKAKPTASVWYSEPNFSKTKAFNHKNILCKSRLKRGERPANISCKDKTFADRTALRVKSTTARCINFSNVNLSKSSIIVLRKVRAHRIIWPPKQIGNCCAVICDDVKVKGQRIQNGVYKMGTTPFHSK